MMNERRTPPGDLPPEGLIFAIAVLAALVGRQAWAKLV